ncbi:MAG: threonine--tRNA ligase [Coriobacteriia bacterium]|nr:threonine--tRNA ligase [Coriobacteriia bacterium]
MKVVLPDGSQKELPKDANIADLAQAIGSGLAKAALAGKIDGTLVDLTTTLTDGQTVEIITDKSPEAYDILRHSTAHVMASAVVSLFEGAQVAIGPAIEDGFYYDFEIGRSFNPDDLELISKKMDELIAAKLPFERKEVSRQEAQEIFKDQKYKLEILEGLSDDEVISIYKVGDFVDLCSGPHLPNTSFVGAYKLRRIAGAYWRGDNQREMLQRIYGTAFFKQSELDAHLEAIEEAEKRDHRKLGRELGIYTMFEEAGPGLPLYLPNGARVIRVLQEWLRKGLYEREYEEVITPHIYKAEVWKTSGHYDYYHDNMYFFNVDEGEGRISEFGVKPMNCPGHVMLYKNDIHSYRELPIRYFEFGTVYRHELSGAVHGLFRARGFTQDDAHVFCREDQLVDELVAIIDLVDYIMGTFDLEYTAEISTRPEESIGSDEMWNHATDSLKEALKRRNLAYEINEGDGAFYGPKIDIKVKDSLGRTWQCSTIQVDFNLPERFDVSYRTADNGQARPYMLHRAIFGSIERFLGILIEHYAGALPLWLSAIQAEIIPIADRHHEYAYEIARELKAVGARVHVASQNEPMRVKIAKAQEQKIPYMLIIGDSEVENKTVSVRERHEGDLGAKPVSELVKILADAQI